MRVLLLHDTQHDLPAVESALVSNGYEVRSMAVDAITLQDEVERWNPELVLIAADDAARDVMEQICVSTQFRERPIVMFTEDHDPVAMRSAMRARVAAYVVAGLNPQRVQPVIEVALARFKQDQMQLAELAGALSAVQAERNGQRSIAQAKALLARRGLSETDAYALLRSTAMRERCSIAGAAERVLAGKSRAIGA
jgi:two-component system, response regulator / RNA-binding antiterminator